MHHSRVAKHPEISEIIHIIVLLFELYILKHIIFILKPIICCFSKNLSPSYYTLLYGYYTHYIYYFIYSSITNSSCLLFLSTVQNNAMYYVKGNILYVLIHLYLLYLLFLDIMSDSLMTCYMFHQWPFVINMSLAQRSAHLGVCWPGFEFLLDY